MLKKHKNSLFHIIKGNDFLSLDSFNISEKNIGDGVMTVISYKNSPLEFTIQIDSDSYHNFFYGYVTFSPTFERISSGGIVLNFEELQTKFEDWLNYDVKEYIFESSEIDLWTEYKNTSSSLNLDEIDFDNKEPFTIDEQRQISMALNELKVLITGNFEITKEQLSTVTDRFDYLDESLEKLNKINWKSLAISTMINISITLALNPDQGKKLFSLFIQVFNALPKLIMGN